MATMIPPKPVPGAPTSEVRVYEHLRELDDGWTVLHSLTWQSIRDGRQGDGEADFLLIHPQFGAVVFEVKGGRLEVRNGCWYSIDRAGQTHEIKNPFDQAKVSKYALVRYLKAMRPKLPPTPVSHAVVFPGVTVTENIGLYGPREIILDRSDLTTLPTSITRVVAHWEQKANLSDSDVERIRGLLAPTVEIRPLLRDRVRQARDGIIDLTNRQIEAFAQLRLIRRLLVTGPAGSGKTILAMERARQLVGDGCTVLLVCFNRLLADHISAELTELEGLETVTFHSLCMSEIRKAGLQIPDSLTDAWWTDEAPTLLEQAWACRGRGVDAVIVDEGQDFAPEWLMTAMMLLNDVQSGPFVVFADSNQEVYTRKWSMPEEVPRVPLDTNCRNTVQIASRLSAFLDDKFNTLGVDGPEPVFIPWTGRGEVTGLVQDIVHGLVNDEGLKSDHIVVLADRRQTVDRLHDVLAGEVAFTAWGGKGVVAETIHRFKGLEADVVVLVFTGDVRTRDEHVRALAYVGMSRARTTLYVVGTEEAREALAWST